MSTDTARAVRIANQNLADLLLRIAMATTLERFGIKMVDDSPALKNTVDAFTAVLIDAEVDMEELDRVLAQANLSALFAKADSTERAQRMAAALG